MSNNVIERATRWEILCEPHIAIRIKRLFPAAHAKQGKIWLSKTPEHGYDLQWFFQRYPFEGAVPSVEKYAEKFVAHREAIAAVLDGNMQETVFETELPLREYQKKAAQLAVTAGSLLIGDDVGLGKTATAIGALACGAPTPALFVTLTHLTGQWAREVQKFAPHLHTHILKKGTPYDMTKGPRGVELPEPDVVITNYHKLAGWQDALRGKVHTVVFDEVQELRRAGSGKYNAASSITSKCKVRLGLSATPIFNYGDEFYNIFNVLKPDALGSKYEFTGEWCLATDMRGRAKIKDPEAFGSYLREQSLLIRRSRADVARELPSVSRIPMEIEADTKTLDRVKGVSRELAQTILHRAGLGRGEKMRAAEELSNVMRQATGLAKAVLVAEHVKTLVESGEKVVLYGWHHSVYDVWMSKLQDYKPVLYTGKQSVTGKDKSAQGFIDGDSQVLIMSLRAGAGLDGLQQVCRTVVFGELDWSPSVHVQAVGRVHRDGQEQPVMAYFMLANGGIDPVIADVLGMKRGQLDPVLNPAVTGWQGQQDNTSNSEKLATYILEGE